MSRPHLRRRNKLIVWKSDGFEDRWDTSMSTNVQKQELTAGAGPTIAILGMAYWLETAAEMVRRVGMRHMIVKAHSYGELVKWALSGQWRQCDLIYHVWGDYWPVGLIGKLVRRPVLWHWFGSDILTFKKRKGWSGVLQEKSVKRWASGHVADSPELAQELKAMGIEAPVVRLLPKFIEADIEPLPATFTVLSYWRDDRRDFYGGNILLKLADEFPQFKFLVANASGKGEPPRPNVEFLGFQTDMPALYRRCSALFRLPEHDSLSAMVLEMMARGRYIIYNKPMTGCHFAIDLDQARAALVDIARSTGPNLAGSEFVRETFSIDKEKQVLETCCRKILLGATE